MLLIICINSLRKYITFNCNEKHIFDFLTNLITLKA